MISSLPAGAELGPVRRDRLVVGQQPAVDQSVNDGGGDALGRGEHHRRGVRRPGLLAIPVGPPCPDVDDRLAVDEYRQRSPAEPAAGEQAGEDAYDVSETGVGGALHIAWQAFLGSQQ